MHLAFDIFQGIGMAAAVGIRPFLPALAACALAAGDVQIHFARTDFSFLESRVSLLLLAACAIALALVERRVAPERLERGVPGAILAAIAAAVGAMLFGGSLSRGGYAIWPGILGGAACAAVGLGATRPLIARARARLGAEAGLLPSLVEATAVLLAVLSVLGPPVGAIGLALLLWLLLARRGREGEKFAGLRILR